MSGFRLTPAAQADLDAIWDYTAERWSVEQANKYIRSIENACKQLAEGTRVAEAIDEVRPGFHQSAIASHILFFRLDVGTVDIVRILHRRMNYTAHFDFDE
jgi:toxin ParE1/3/4